MHMSDNMLKRILLYKVQHSKFDIAQLNKHVPQIHNFRLRKHNNLPISHLL